MRCAAIWKHIMISEPSLHRMKILVIDDDRLSVTLLEQLLQRHGYSRVMGITNSRAAAETCATFDPDLILLDLIMPEVDGLAVLEALRSDVSERFLPIVVLTADTTEETKGRALEAGANDCPVQPPRKTPAPRRTRTLLRKSPSNMLVPN